MLSDTKPALLSTANRRLTMLGLLHWCAVRTSLLMCFLSRYVGYPTLIVRIWEIAGGIERWCDEQGD